MIEFTTFKKCMEAILAMDEKEHVMGTIFPSYCGEFSAELNECLIEMVASQLGDKDAEMLYWWLYDSNGRDNAVIYYKDGRQRKLDTLAALYDYFVEEG